VADPGPVAQTFFADDEVRAGTRLDGIVTVVDALHASQQLGRSKEVTEQIAFADVILLNKIDLVSPAELDKLEARIKRMNAAARVYRTTRGNVDLDKVLNVGGFNLDRVLEIEPDFLKEDKHDHHKQEHVHDEHCNHDHEEPRHDDEVGSVGIVQPGEVDVKKFNNWLSDLMQTRGQDLYRLKGILAIRGEPRRYVFQGVHMQLDAGPDKPWGTTPKVNKLVFIGRNLDRALLNEGFQKCLV